MHLKVVQKFLLVVSLLLVSSNPVLASSPKTKNQWAENGTVECDDVTGIFLQEWNDGERLLNSFIKLKGVSKTLNYTTEIKAYFESNTPNSALEIGCLQNLEGVAIRYDNEQDISIIIQIDNDGRIQTYPETPSFGIDVEKSFRGPS